MEYTTHKGPVQVAWREEGDPRSKVTMGDAWYFLDKQKLPRGPFPNEIKCRQEELYHYHPEKRPVPPEPKKRKDYREYARKEVCQFLRLGWGRLQGWKDAKLIQKVGIRHKLKNRGRLRWWFRREGIYGLALLRDLIDMGWRRRWAIKMVEAAIPCWDQIEEDTEEFLLPFPEGFRGGYRRYITFCADLVPLKREVDKIIDEEAEEKEEIHQWK